MSDVRVTPSASWRELRIHLVERRGIPKAGRRPADLQARPPALQRLRNADCLDRGPAFRNSGTAELRNCLSYASTSDFLNIPGLYAEILPVNAEAATVSGDAR